MLAVPVVLAVPLVPDETRAPDEADALMLTVVASADTDPYGKLQTVAILGQGSPLRVFFAAD